MQGHETLEFAPGEYRIVPSEEFRDVRGRLSDLVAGDTSAFDDETAFHKFTVERPTGEPVLEILETGETGSIDVGVSLPARRDVYLFRQPGGDPLLRLETPLSGWGGTYPIETLTRGEELGSVAESGLVFTNLELRGPTGTVHATVEKRRPIRNRLPLSGPPSYVVSGPEGDEFANLDVERMGGSLAGLAMYQMAITCDRSSIPTEICLVLSFVVYRRTMSSGSTSGGNGGD